MAATRSSSWSGTRQRALFTTIFAAALTTCLTTDSSSSCSSTTLEPLQDFRSAFTDPSNTVFSTWTANADCCTWKGITCQDGALIALDLQGSEQVTRNQSYSSKPGHTLPKLKHLQTLKLSNLQFSSKIPSQWSSFSDNLIVLAVTNCDLEDEIPSGIASNSHLQTLDLKANRLTGDIPSKLCNLKELKFLDVSYNMLDTGDVPGCIANGGSVTNVNYGHQSSENSSSNNGGGSGSGSGSGSNGTYSPYYSGGASTLQVQKQVVVATTLLLLPLLI